MKKVLVQVPGAHQKMISQYGVNTKNAAKMLAFGLESEICDVISGILYFRMSIILCALPDAVASCRGRGDFKTPRNLQGSFKFD